MSRAAGHLAGQVVVITGASSGIGEAVARRAAGEGATVVVAARRADKLQALVTDLTRDGHRALAVPGDVTDPSAARTLVDRTVAAFGRIDVMVCNAGIGFHAALEATPVEVMRRLVDVNLMGTLFAAHAALVPMRRADRGHIIAVSSIVGRRGIEGSAVYSATKAAQVAFIEALRAECLGTGIYASVVLPVSTVTEFHAAIARDYGQTVHGRGPKQSADQVAEAVVDCMIRPRPEVWPYKRARWLAVLNVLAPGLTDRIVRRYRRAVRSAE